jgi:hypothetical protein
MGYYINFKEISIEEFRDKLKKADLLPSRVLLKTDLEQRFELFKQHGVRNLLELQQFLKKTTNTELLARSGLVTEDYLNVLLREINSMQPKPCKIIEFTMLNKATVQKLSDMGIHTTLQLFDYICKASARKALAENKGIPEDELKLLASLTDLNRVRWVGATFAQMLYKCGYTSAKVLARANYETLHSQINRLNKESQFFKGAIGLHDMKLCVEAASDVSGEMEI